MTAITPSQDRKIERMILALLTSRTLKDAAKVLGCHPRTLMRHQKHEAFQAQYKEVKRALLGQATARLRAESGAAVAALAQVVATGDSWTEPVFFQGKVCGKVKKFSPAARVSAATKIIELALRAHEIEDLTERLERLERSLQK